MISLSLLSVRAAVEAERVLQLVQALAGGLVTAVHEPAIGGEQRGRTEIPVAVPPVTRTAR